MNKDQNKNKIKKRNKQRKNHKIGKRVSIELLNIIVTKKNKNENKGQQEIH